MLDARARFFPFSALFAPLFSLPSHSRFLFISALFLPHFRPPPSFPVIPSDTVSRGDIEESTVALFKVFASQGLLLPFVCKLAEWDIGLCHAGHLVFRKNRCVAEASTRSGNEVWMGWDESGGGGEGGTIYKDEG